MIDDPIEQTAQRISDLASGKNKEITASVNKMMRMFDFKNERSSKDLSFWVKHVA